MTTDEIPACMVGMTGAAQGMKSVAEMRGTTGLELAQAAGLSAIHRPKM